MKPKPIISRLPRLRPNISTQRARLFGALGLATLGVIASFIATPRHQDRVRLSPVTSETRPTKSNAFSGQLFVLVEPNCSCSKSVFLGDVGDSADLSGHTDSDQSVVASVSDRTLKPDRTHGLCISPPVQLGTGNSRVFSAFFADSGRSDSGFEHVKTWRGLPPSCRGPR